MKNRKMKLCFAYIAVFVVFCLVIGIIQVSLKPVYMGDSSSIVDGFYKQEQNSIDVLFMGPSQMFCTVDAQVLTEVYGIKAYDFGASDQHLTMTKYYLQEALKVQSPKIVLIEVCQFYGKNEDITEAGYSWSYDPMEFSLNKIRSIAEVSGNVYDVLQYGVLPILSRHSRWTSVTVGDILYNWDRDKSSYDYSSKGFMGIDYTVAGEIAYLSEDDGTQTQVPQETAKALKDIAAICEQNNIELIFFKAPAADWHRAESEGVKAFMEENSLTFLDLNDYLNEIGIDGSTDLSNISHLNIQGAEKTTKFLGEYLLSHYELN